MTKAELRRHYKQERQLLSDIAIDDASLEIANQVLKLPIWNKSYFHIFLSINEHKEINTDYILNILSGKDKHIIISRSNFNDFSMQHYLLLDNTIIKKNHWNIPEPVDGIEIDVDKIEVVFVPLLAFDKQGHRIGYGKGFYDKFLSQCRPETIKIGLSLFQAEENFKDVYESDIALDYCVTPSQIYQFGTNSDF